MPSFRWRELGVHWHAYRERGSVRNPAVPSIDRVRRLDTAPLAALYTPDEVAEWIEAQTRDLGERRTVRAIAEREWVEIGDTDDLNHLYSENVLIAARGDSIYTDIYSESENIQLFLEVVSAHECPGH
ncbi:MAG: hypothetical protein JWQ81_7791 [Amycolatopsis sp.]|nr:hypothetical protein [Amycolatopsis sp.]